MTVAPYQPGAEAGFDVVFIPGVDESVLSDPGRLLVASTTAARRVYLLSTPDGRETLPQRQGVDSETMPTPVGLPR